jgi:hypothetical protein
MQGDRSRMRLVAMHGEITKVDAVLDVEAVSVHAHYDRVVLGQESQTALKPAGHVLVRPRAAPAQYLDRRQDPNVCGSVITVAVSSRANGSKKMFAELVGHFGTGVLNGILDNLINNVLLHAGGAAGDCSRRQ